MKRRDFVRTLGTALISLPIILELQACGGESDTSSNSNNSTTEPAKSFKITNADSSSHSHTLTITCTALTGEGATFKTGSGAGHTHDVAVTKEQLAKVAAGEEVAITIDQLGHQHTFKLKKPASIC